MKTTYRNYEISIEQDDDECNNPREWDNLGTMVCFHRKYNLGDKHTFSAVEDFQLFLEEEKPPVVLPLYLYDHSGITIRTIPFSCRFDSGQVGYIYATKEDIRKEHNCKKITKDIIEKVTKILEDEVKIYDKYVTGEVYGYIITNSEGEVIESLWGFFEDEDFILEQAKESINYLLDEKLPKQLMLFEEVIK